MRVMSPIADCHRRAGEVALEDVCHVTLKKVK